MFGSNTTFSLWTMDDFACLRVSQIARLASFTIYRIFPFSRDSHWYFCEKRVSFSTKFLREELQNEPYCQPYFTAASRHPQWLLAYDYSSLHSSSQENWMLLQVVWPMQWLILTSRQSVTYIHSDTTWLEVACLTQWPTLTKRYYALYSDSAWLAGGLPYMVTHPD
jgi:hypothetical protein